MRGHRCDLCSSTWIKRLLSTSPVLLGRYLLCWAVDAIDGFAVANPLLGHSPRTGQLASRLSVPCANGAMSLICFFGDFCPFVPAAYTCLLGGRCHRWIRGRKSSPKGTRRAPVKSLRAFLCLMPHANGAMSLICCLGDLCTLRSCVPASYTCLLGGDAIDGFAVAVLF